MDQTKALCIGLLLTAMLTGCFRPNPDEVTILSVTQASPNSVVAEIETLDGGTPTVATHLRVRFQFLIDQQGFTGAPPPTSWAMETTTWTPGPTEETRLVEASFDENAVGAAEFRAFDRVIVGAIAWQGGEEPEDGVSDEAVYFYSGEQFQTERPVALQWDVADLPQSEFGFPLIESNQPAAPESGPYARVVLTEPRRVATVVQIALNTIPDVNAQAWFETSSGLLETVTIPAGATESPGFVVSGPPLPGLSQTESGPQWDGTTDLQGEGAGLVFSAVAMINGLEEPSATKGSLTEP